MRGAGGTSSDGWLWIYLEGRLPAKNRIAGAAGAGRKFFKPKRIVEAERFVRRAFGEALPATIYPLLSPCEYRLTIFRRTPLEARTGQRNVARGDPASAHEFLIDALQGCFYVNDEQLMRGSFEELRCQDADGYLFMVRPILMDKNARCAVDKARGGERRPEDARASRPLPPS